MNAWETVKIFVSSTFLDLELERDRLSEIFARIKKQLSARHISLIPYDLRWREKHTDAPLVKWCLSMTRQCQYFIGILGYRYGWRPCEDEEGRPNHKKLSVTEMEINQALLSIPKERRFFCLGEKEQYDPGRIAQVSDLDKNSLEQLKQRLIKSGERVYTFNSSQELLEIVEKELTQRLDMDYPKESIKEFHYTLSQALEEILEQKTKNFVGRGRYLEQLEKFSLDQNEKNYLGIHAVAGTGKSALLSRFILDWRKKHPQVPIVSHFMGMTADSRRVSNMLFHIGEQLHRAGILKEKLSSDPIEQRKQVRDALETCNQKMLLALDGLDEMEESGYNLFWLPRNLPSCVRVIVTTRPVDPWPTLQGYSRLQQQELPPLFAQEIKEIIQDHSLTYGLNLKEEEIALLQKQASGNPLYLKVALEEIGKGGVAIGQLATSVEALFEQILERLGRRYGNEIIQDYLGLIGASRYGLAENELQEILMLMHQTQKDFADDFLLAVKRSLDNFIVLKGGILDFFHAQFGRTVKERLGKRNMRAYHSFLAQYFKDKGLEYTRALREICYQEQWAEEYQKLLTTLTHLPFLEAKCEANMVDGLAEDYENALKDPVVKIPENASIVYEENVVVSRKTLELFLRVLTLDLKFLRSHPTSLFQSFWNRCYWYDAPEARQHYQKTPSNKISKEKNKTYLYLLMQKWYKEKAQGHTWVESKRPSDPPLDSPLHSLFHANDGPVRGIAWHPDQRRFACASEDSTIKIWDKESRECLLTLRGHEKEARGVCFSPDGKQLLSCGNDGLAFSWDTQTGDCLEIFEGHHGPVSSALWSKDSKWVFTASEDATICIWDASCGTCLKILEGHKLGILKIALSPDGSKLASSSSDHTIRIWDVHSGICINTIQGHDRIVNSIAWHPHGNMLASASKDNTIRLWNPITSECSGILSEHKESVTDIAFSSEGDTLLSVSEDNSLLIWNLETKELWNVWERWEWKPLCVAFSPNDRWILCGASDKTVSLWEWEKEKTLQTLEGAKAQIQNIVFSSEYRILAAASCDTHVYVWNLETHQCEKILHGLSTPAQSVAISSDGKRIASGSEDGKIIVWNRFTGECLKTFHAHHGRVYSLSFRHRDSHLVSVGYFDKKICLWDIQSLKCLYSMEGHEKWVQTTAWSSDRKLLVTGSRDCTARIWDIEKKECLHVLRGPDSSVSCVSFSPDNTTLASGTYEGILYLWNVKTGACTMVLRGHKDLVLSIAIDKKGKVYSCDRSKNLRVWDSSTGECLGVQNAQGDMTEIVREDTPFYILVKDWESVVFSKETHQPLAYLPEPILPALFFSPKEFCGIGQTATNQIYIELVQSGQCKD